MTGKVAKWDIYCILVIPCGFVFGPMVWWEVFVFGYLPYPGDDVKSYFLSYDNEDVEEEDDMEQDDLVSLKGVPPILQNKEKNQKFPLIF